MSDINFKPILYIFPALILFLTIFSPFLRGYEYDDEILSPKIVYDQADNTVEQEADQLLNRGIEQAKINKFAAAFSDWRKALRLYQEIVINPLIDEKRQSAIQKKIADTSENLGDGHHSLGQYVEAITYYQQGLVIHQSLNDRQREANILGSLGISHGALGQYGKAIDYPQQALTISQEIGNRLGEVIALSNLGEGYHALGRYDKAIELQQQSLTILQQIQPQNENIESIRAWAIGRLGDTHHSLGQYQKALDYHRQSLSLLHQFGSRRQIAKALGQLGKTHHSLADYQQAIEHHRQGIAIHREIGDRWGEGKALNNLGLAYRFLKQQDKAILSHREALNVNRKIGARQGEAQALNNLGTVFVDLGEYKQAIDWQEQSLAIFQDIGDRLGEGITLSHLGENYNRLEAYSKAEVLLYKAIDVYESLRKRLRDEQKISIFDTQANAYQHLQQALIAQNKFSQALTIAERGRSRAFVELLATRIATSQDSSQTIDILEALNFDAIQQVAREQQATLVEYALLPKLKKIYVWVVNPQGTLEFRSIDLSSLETSLEELVAISRQQMGVRSRDNRGLELASDVNIEDNLQELHRLLIDPIGQFLPDNPSDRVIFVPQGSLFLVPFPALTDSDGHALISKHTILTTPAIQVLQLTHKAQQDRIYKNKTNARNWKKSLIIGNPAMPSVGIPPRQLSNLPGAEIEAKRIAKLLGSRPLIGAEATKEQVLSQVNDTHLIHIATHGLLDNFGYDTPGAIALAPTREDNGLLTAGEIINLELQTNLVVLSACNTGQGDIRGDGVVGLSRSLLTAGSTSVIVSLWAVPDEPTAVLMEQFYHLMNQGFDKAQALRQAMLETKERYPDPVNWAAFTLIGES